MRRKKEPTAHDAAIRSLLPSGAASVIARTFEFMGIAEDEIKRARLKGGPRGELGGKAFRALHPGAPLVELGDEVYRAHCVEIIARVKAGQDLRPATDAEILAVLRTTSLVAPLTSGGAAVMARIFARVFPGKLVEEMTGPDRETWPGQVEETLADMRRKYRREDRVAA